MLGRLKNLPLTFVGGLALGLAETYAIWKLPTGLLNKMLQPSNLPVYKEAPGGDGSRGRGAHRT